MHLPAKGFFFRDGMLIIQREIQKNMFAARFFGEAIRRGYDIAPVSVVPVHIADIFNDQHASGTVWNLLGMGRHAFHRAYAQVRLLPGKHMLAAGDGAVIKGRGCSLHVGIVFRFAGVIIPDVLKNRDGSIRFIAFAQHAFAAEPCIACKVQKHGCHGGQKREQRSLPAHAQTALAAMFPYHPGGFLLSIYHLLFSASSAGSHPSMPDSSCCIHLRMSD